MTNTVVSFDCDDDWHIRHGRCPCGGELVWGPIGGLSQNAACKMCLQRYNVPPRGFEIERMGFVQIDKHGNVIW